MSCMSGACNACVLCLCWSVGTTCVWLPEQAPMQLHLQTGCVQASTLNNAWPGCDCAVCCWVFACRMTACLRSVAWHRRPRRWPRTWQQLQQQARLVGSHPSQVRGHTRAGDRSSAVSRWTTSSLQSSKQEESRQTPCRNPLWPAVVIIALNRCVTAYAAGQAPLQPAWPAC